VATVGRSSSASPRGVTGASPVSATPARASRVSRSSARRSSVSRRRAAARGSALAFDAAEDVELAAPVEVFEVGQEAARLELGQAREPTLDPLGEFARRLAGEGQAEDLVATDEPVGDEPERPGPTSSRSCRCLRRRRRAWARAAPPR
jgi:hypothetical protein